MSEMQSPPWAKLTFDNLVADIAPGPMAEGESERDYTARLDRALVTICGVNRAALLKRLAREKARKSDIVAATSKNAQPTPRRLIEAAVCIRWNCASDTLRAFMVGRRRPNIEKNPKFFEDLAWYGRATVADGALVKDTVGNGPDYVEFLLSTPAGGDRSRAA